MEHEWRPVVGYEGIYKVRQGADGGRVQRVAPIKRSYSGRELGRPRPDGYYRANLSKPGCKPQLRYLHILILEAFVGPCPPGMEALHDDDVKSNNTLPNLRWGTRSQNVKDTWENKRRPRGDRPFRRRE